MEFPCSASLGAMGSLLRKLDGLLRITQPGPLKESIWRLLNLSRIRADLMRLSEVHDLSLASSNYLAEERFNAYKLPKLDELLRAEDSTPSLHQLRDCLGTIAIKLEKLSDSLEVNRHSHRASYWMKDARELSYEIEDFVDQFFFIHDDTSADAAMPSWMDKISGFVTRVEEVRERYDRFKLEYVLSDPTNTAVNHCHLRGLRAQAQTEPFLPIGIEELTNELLKLVKWKEDEEDDHQLRVICILGAEGLGKTTLARRLWRHLEEEFDCQAFVQTAKRPDMRLILRSILSQVRPKQQPKACEVPNLIQDLRKYLQDKRYFIIIDDIWAVSAWDVISCAFPEDNYRSRILTTTTDVDVALACCGYEPEHIFKMKPLNDYQSQKLFVDRAFGSGNGCPPEFRNVITDGIIKRCGGLPLAIICIATLIAEQQEEEIAYQLEYMQNFLGRNLRTNATSEEILKQAFCLCYSYLPDCLKTCLLYLSVYPENYYIQKDDLVKQWIAEDFICRTELRKDIVEVARSYFDELVRYGLIQEMDTNGKEKGLLSAVHPAVFDFITSKSIEDNFISIIDFSQSTVAPTDKVRRLCLHFGSATYATAPSSIGLSQVRSLIVMGLLKCMPSLVEFKLVRVAILHIQVDGDGDTSFPLTGICRMVLLRYLQVKCNVAVELPDQMWCLKHLETLEIHARVAAFPSDFVHLPSLLHLRLGRGRYHRHRRRTLSYLSPLETLSSDGSSRAARSIPIFGFPPFICMITKPPEWIAPSQNLDYLEVDVTKRRYDVDAVLRQLTKATRIIIRLNTKDAFQGLEHLGMRKLQKLLVGFDVNVILRLKSPVEITASIGKVTGSQESDDWTALEPAFKDSIGKRFLSIIMSKRGHQINHEYEPSKRQSWHQLMREQVNWWLEQPGILGKMQVKDKKNCNKNMLTDHVPVIRSGDCSDIGSRRYMEDTLVCIPDLAKNFGCRSLDNEVVSFYGVFDGHGGKGAAQFVRDNLPRVITEDSDFPHQLEKVIRRSFMQIDEQLCKAYPENSALCSGTTALIAIIFRSSLLVANAGDSRAVLSRSGAAIEMSVDHRPSSLSEKTRIESLGGYVDDGYLNGQLSVSRALGDWHLEDIKGVLSAEPELKMVMLTKDDEFLIIGSDAIWDFFSSQDAVSFARNCLKGHNDPQQCCKQIVEEAKRRGACDNLTAVLISFHLTVSCSPGTDTETPPLLSPNTRSVSYCNDQSRGVCLRTQEYARSLMPRSEK